MSMPSRPATASIAAEPVFALKGGTAINLFVRDLPRLSVDIDLTYLPVEPRDGDIELKRIYTLAPLHGGGLGAALMARAVDDARAAGRRRMLLGVYGGNARAQRFYGKQGFAIVGERRFLVGATWHDDLIFARDL